ncbi:MAG: hypothetical protein Q9174_000648 [Haloplaca sp. 1 TL-2023]
MLSRSLLLAGLALLFATPLIRAQDKVAAARRGLITDAPTVVQKRGGDLNIGITNSYGQPLSLSFKANAGLPGFVGNPQPTQLPTNGQASFAVPPEWAGRIYVGKTLNEDNTKIEGSWKGVGTGFFDVSLVDGYSVPITCSVGGKAIFGCNKELFDQPCQGPDHAMDDGAVCHNAAQNIPWGPPSAFFAPCAGASYIFPKDDRATQGWATAETEMSCCVGTSCPPSMKQGSFKRDFVTAKAPSLMPLARRLAERLNGAS